MICNSQAIGGMQGHCADDPRRDGVRNPQIGQSVRAVRPAIMNTIELDVCASQCINEHENRKQ